MAPAQIRTRFHDPHGIYGRRALRLAVAFPLTLVILWPILGLSTSAVLYGAFACFGTTTMLDLGGRMSTRIRAYAATLAVSWVSILLGSAVTFSVWSAVLATLVWCTLVNYLGVLRGYVAAAVPLVLIPWFIAISTRGDLSQVPVNLAAWTVGFVLAAGFALTFWPVRLQDQVRAGLAVSLHALADFAEARWVRREADLTVPAAGLQRAAGQLDAVLRGILIRPGGATSHERHRMELVGVVRQLTVVIQRFPHRDDTMSPPDQELAQESAHALRESAACVLSTRVPHPRPDVMELNTQREAHRAQAIRWIQRELTPQSAESVVRRAANQETIRFVSGLCVLAASHARGSVGEDPRFIGMGTLDGRPMYVVPPAATPWAALRSNANFRSVWLRNALRAGVGFALAVAIIWLTGVAHGFWVALGVLSALRFDASGSRRTIGQILLGTVVGFLLGSAVVWVTQDSTPVMWVLLAISVALATYTPGAMSMTVSQASFTVFLIVLFGLLTPDRFQAAEARLLDVLLAIGVTLLVSVLMWPGGASALVRSSLRRSATTAGDYVAAAFHRLAVGPSADAGLGEAAQVAATEYLRATENFDLATAKQVPGGVPMEQWVRAANSTAEVLTTAQKIVFFARSTPAGEICPRTTQTIDAQAVNVSNAFVAKVCRSCGLDQSPGPLLSSDDLGMHSAVECLTALAAAGGGHLDQDQASAALTLVWAICNLAGIRASAQELAAEPAVVDETTAIR